MLNQNASGFIIDLVGLVPSILNMFLCPFYHFFTYTFNSLQVMPQVSGNQECKEKKKNGDLFAPRAMNWNGSIFLALSLCQAPWCHFPILGTSWGWESEVSERDRPD